MLKTSHWKSSLDWVQLQLRRSARLIVVTGNTARYRVEGPRLEDALRRVGKIEVLLDAGAGGGYYARYLYSRFAARLIALEPDPHLFHLLTRELSDIGNRVTLQQSSIPEIPLPDGSVDVATCTQVLEHIPNDRAAMAELARVIRPGGFLLITVPQPPAPWLEGGHVREGYTLEALSCLAQPNYLELVDFDWFLTRSTQLVIMRAKRRGGLSAGFWNLGELKQTKELRQQSLPYGLLALFKKSGKH